MKKLVPQLSQLSLLRLSGHKLPLGPWSVIDENSKAPTIDGVVGSLSGICREIALMKVMQGWSFVSGMRAFPTSSFLSLDPVSCAVELVRFLFSVSLAIFLGDGLESNSSRHVNIQERLGFIACFWQGFARTQCEFRLQLKHCWFKFCLDTCQPQKLRRQSWRRLLHSMQTSSS